MMKDVNMAEDPAAMPMENDTGVAQPDYTPTPSEEAYIAKWISKLDKAEEKYKTKFERMEENQSFAASKQWPGQDKDDPRYVVNIVQQVIRQRVAALYAKNPTVTAKKSPRLDYKIWDGKQQTLAAAMQNPTLPENMMLIEDVLAGRAQREKLDRIGKTLEIAVRKELGQQFPNFKRMMKIMVRRTDTCGVGYLKMDFQRKKQPRPEIESRISDCTEQLSRLEMLLAQQGREDFDENSAKAEEIKNTIAALQENKWKIVREGVVFSFPRAGSIIPDDACTQLEGFLGANWVAEKFWLDKDDIERIYKVKLGASTQSDNEVSSAAQKSKKKDKKDTKGKTAVYEIYNKENGTKFTIARGHKCYLRKPEAQMICLERFFPYFALTFNDLEDETSIFPPSTVDLIRHIQLERNRCKEALRQHRIAKAPKYAGSGAGLSVEDKQKIATAPAHYIAWWDSLQPGEKPGDKFAEITTANIDPNVYETGSLREDIEMAVGMAGANLSSPSGVTATESSIVQDSRQSDIASNIDDLDDFLTAVFKEVGNLYFLEVSAETISSVVGPGAVWPEFSAEEVMGDIYLEVEAGSSGRPNKAVEVSSLTQIIPLIVQIPGIPVKWLAEKLIRMVDENIDLSDAYVEGLPSIAAMNAMAGAMGGPTGIAGAQVSGGANNPHAQGGSGGIAVPAAPIGRPQVSNGLMTPPHMA